MAIVTRILVAEDEPAIAKLIEFKLSREGFVVTIARDGGEAISMLETSNWDLVILDVMMPVATGWEVLKELRSRSARRETPVIMLSGKAEHAELPAQDSRTLRLGKPFDPDGLARTVRSLVSQETTADNDLSELRGEFLESFPERRSELEAQSVALARALGSGNQALAREAMLAIHVVAHKLAGAAGTYGFRALGSLSEALDDLLSAEIMREAPIELDRLGVRTAVLAQALAECHASSGDCPRVSALPEARRLISDAGALPTDS